MIFAGLAANNLANSRQRLLNWYTAHQRDLPWRRTTDPYAIWISEIMLQQTRVAVVVERFRQFLHSFPTVAALAEADEQQVLALWSGLGYYRRARMLHQAAKSILQNGDGRLPLTAAELCRLPGIGPYTAAAVASIAYGEAVAVVDGNVERVLCRLTGRDVPESKNRAKHRKEIDVLAAQLLDPAHPGDFNQALMELGATVCTPRSPQCPTCPFFADCLTRGEHKTAAKPKMQSRAVACALVLRTRTRQGVHEVLLEQRSPAQTVMPGLWELPWLSDPHLTDEQTELAVRHAIMLVNYQVRVRRLSAKELEPLAAAAGLRQWIPLPEAAGMALTGLARKILVRTHLIAAVAARRTQGVL